MAKSNGLVRASSDSFPPLTDRSSDTATGPFIGVIAEVVKRYIAGEEIETIALACRVSEKTITNKISVLRKAGYYIPHRRTPKSQARDQNKHAKFVVTADASVKAINAADKVDDDLSDIYQRQTQKSTLQQSEEYIETLRQFHGNREVTRSDMAFSRF